MSKYVTFAFCVIFLLIAGCVKYKEKPLIPHEILKEIEEIRSRNAPTGGDILSFAQAAELMSLNSPQLSLVKIKYKAAQGIADIKTPWFNPSIELGPNIGTNMGAGATGKIGPFVGLGFTIPLGGKLKKNDNLNAANAKRKFLEIQARHRELFLELRRIYTQMYIVCQKEKSQKDLTRLSNLTLKTSLASHAAGTSNALEVGMVEMEHNKTELDLIDINLELEEKKSILANILGTDLSKMNAFIDKPILKIDQILPGIDELKKILIDNNLELARLKFDYEIAEKKLQLEISKQYPDIQFGSEGEKEVGSDTILLGLRLGISIPIFDRNQHGISEAQMQREMIKTEYLSTLHKALSDLQSNYSKIKAYTERRTTFKTQIQRNANENLRLADQAMKVGGLGIFEYLNVLKNYNETMKVIIHSEACLQLAWLDLEAILCYPINDSTENELFSKELYKIDIQENENE